MAILLLLLLRSSARWSIWKILGDIACGRLDRMDGAVCIEHIDFLVLRVWQKLWAARIAKGHIDKMKIDVLVILI